MIKHLCAAAALLAVSLPSARTSLEPFLRQGFGSTLFRMEQTFPLTGTADSIPDNTRGLGQSELEYPLDAILAGLRYRYETGGGGWV
jgi:hypothetical protein